MTKRKTTPRRRRNQADSARNTAKIRKMALNGRKPSSIARECRCTTRYVYMVLGKLGLPRNVPVTPGSRREQQIVSAYVKFRGDEEALGKMFSQAPRNIKSIIASVRSR